MFQGGDKPLRIVGFVLTRNALYGLVQQTTQNTSLPFVHTARRSYRLEASVRTQDDML